MFIKEKRFRQSHLKPFQFTLVSTLLVFALVALGLSWLTHQWRSFRGELYAAAALESRYNGHLEGPEQKNGPPSSRPLWHVSQIRYGRLYYPVKSARFTEYAVLDETAWNLLTSFQYLDHLWIQGCQPPVSADFSFCSKLSSLVISNCQLTAHQKSSISRIENLRELQLLNVGVTDGDLEYIGELTELKSLDVAENNISDDGIAHLSTLHVLEELCLNETTISGAALEYLSCQSTLKRLFLSGSDIGDTHLDKLLEFPDLEELSLCRTRVTDRGVQTIASVKKLRALYLNDTAITDLGVENLSARAHKLVCLHMSRTSISDECIRFLRVMPSLNANHCVFSDTNISDEGMLRWTANPM